MMGVEVRWEWMGGGVVRGEDLGRLSVDKFWKCRFWRWGERLGDVGGGLYWGGICFCFFN